MKSIVCFLALLLCFAATADASISSLPWSTAVNCSPATFPPGSGSGSNVCDGVEIGVYGSLYSGISAASNYSGGGGGNGFYVEYGDGNTTSSTGPMGNTLNINFATAKTEFYMRFHVKMENGMPIHSGTGFAYHKLLYFFGTSANLGYLDDDNGWRVVVNGSQAVASNGINFYDLYDSGNSDGSWHGVEVYVNTSTKNFKMWVYKDNIDNATPVMNGTANWSAAIKYIQFPQNAKTNYTGAANGQVYDMMIDDLAISSTGRIGPVSGGATPDETDPVISITSPTSSATYDNGGAALINIGGTASDNEAVTSVTWANSRGGSGTATGTTSWSASNIQLYSGNDNVITITAHDAADNTSTDTITVTYTPAVDSEVPVIAITSPTTSTSYDNGNVSLINISGTAIDNVAVDYVTWSNSQGGSGTATGTTSWSISGIQLYSGISNLITVTAYDTTGNFSSDTVTVTYTPSTFDPLTIENFTDQSFASRGWYDNTTHGTIVSGGYSGNCLQWAWSQGQDQPANGGAMRKQFTATDRVYVRFYVKFASDWEGSHQDYHPHLIHFLSDSDDAWTSLANNYLNNYIEFIATTSSPYNIQAQVDIQDNRAIAACTPSYPCDLTEVTETRSVGGCNGVLGDDGTQAVQCFSVGGGLYYNALSWRNSTDFLSKNAWHLVETYWQMNTVTDGVANADGIQWMRVDGDIVLDSSTVTFRTGANSQRKWDKVVLAPYMGDLSPKAQTMWIDELEIYSDQPYNDTTPPDILSVSPVGNIACQSSTTLEVYTGEPATCRYGESGDAWGDMSEMTSTGGTYHTQIISGLLCQSLYQYDVRCQDGDANEAQENVDFFVLAPDPNISGITLHGVSKIIVTP